MSAGADIMEKIIELLQQIKREDEEAYCFLCELVPCYISGFMAGRPQKKPKGKIIQINGHAQATTEQ